MGSSECENTARQVKQGMQGSLLADRCRAPGSNTFLETASGLRKCSRPGDIFGEAVTGGISLYRQHKCGAKGDLPLIDAFSWDRSPNSALTAVILQLDLYALHSCIQEAPQLRQIVRLQHLIIASFALQSLVWRHSKARKTDRPVAGLEAETAHASQRATPS
ncbi:hypothetical protein KC341_g104, partial [Hortaea werneckii]